MVLLAGTAPDSCFTGAGAFCYNGRVPWAELRWTGTERLRASVVRDLAGLTGLEAEWRALASLCPTATVFQTWEWNVSWWHHFRRVPGRGLRVLLLRAPDGTLVGLAPLMTSFWYATPLRRLSFLGTGTSDYLDVLAAPGWEDAVAEGFYGYLENSRGWQIADFQQLREGGFLRDRPPAEGSRLVSQDAPGEPCPYLALPPAWEMLLQGLGKKTRTNIGYYDRALAKVYEVDVGFVRDEADVDAALARLFELHQRRWNQRWLPGAFAGRRVQAFHREAARRLLAQGWLRLFHLRLDGLTQASLYCFAYGDRLCYYQGGFEPTLARLSLGTVLTGRAMQSAITEDRQVFDFLRGDEPYKAKWTGLARVNARRLITRPGTPFPALAQRVQGWEETVETRGKAWMRGKK